MTTRQRQRETTRDHAVNNNQVHPDFESVESTDGVTFSGGNMIVDGQPQIPEEVANWESSNGVTQYTTVLWKEPDTDKKRVSCNCPGWAMKKPGKPRRCKHTDDMMGIKTCNATKASSTVIASASQAAAVIPKFQARPMRGIMLE